MVRLTPRPHLVIPAQFANGADTTVRGMEVSARAQIGRRLRVDGSYSWLLAHANEINTPFGSPEQTAVLGASFDAGRHWEIGSRFYLAGSVPEIPFVAPPIEGYRRLDLRAARRFDRVTVGVTGQNLTGTHVESDSHQSGLVTALPRSVHATIQWQF